MPVLVGVKTYADQTLYHNLCNKFIQQYGHIIHNAINLLTISPLSHAV